MLENTISINNVDGEYLENDLLISHLSQPADDNDRQSEKEVFLEEQDCENLELEKTMESFEETLKLNVYGEQVDLPVSQAKVIAQKGLAFEHLKGQLINAKNDVRLRMLDDMANISGKTVPQLIRQIHQQVITDQLLNEYGDMNSVPYDKLCDAVKELENTEFAAEKSSHEIKRENYKSQFREFLQNVPGCTQIPDEVLQKVENGENLSVAYFKYDNEKLKNDLYEKTIELEKLKKEQLSRMKSTPSVINVGAKNNIESQEFYNLFRSTW